MNELKPCPFCGGTAFAHKIYASLWSSMPTDLTVLCKDCRAGIRKYFKTEAEAIEAWNRRVDNE